MSKLNFPSLPGRNPQTLQVFPGNPYTNIWLSDTLELIQAITSNLARLSTVKISLDNCFFLDQGNQNFLALPFRYKKISCFLVLNCRTQKSYITDWQGDVLKIHEIETVISGHFGATKASKATDTLKTFSNALILLYPALTTLIPESTHKRHLCRFLLPVEPSSINSVRVNLDIDPFFTFLVYVPRKSKISEWPQLLSVECTGTTSFYMNRLADILNDKFLFDIKGCMFEAVEKR